MFSCFQVLRGDQERIPPSNIATRLRAELRVERRADRLSIVSSLIGLDAIVRAAVTPAAKRIDRTFLGALKS